jgi:ketol-acid reductoisomerase
MYRQDDADPAALADQQIAVIGYGSQGRAQAMNLRNSGFRVQLGLRAGGSSHAAAIEDGWNPLPIREAVEGSDLVAMLLPDTAQPRVFDNEVKAALKPGALLLFSHGFNIHYKTITVDADKDVAMVAPKGPGILVRRQFVQGKGVPCLLAVHQDSTGTAEQRALAYAHGIGGTRAGVLETSFAEETETDLFGEQAVLCGGVTELIVAGFETLLEAGYQPEIAYFECLHEMKLIVDLIYEGGFAKMHRFVSDTAKYGDLSRGPRVIDGAVRARMREVLKEVRSGQFAREWIDEDRSGRQNYESMLQRDLNHSIEEVGSRLRADMSWLDTPPKAEATA